MDTDHADVAAQLAELHEQLLEKVENVETQLRRLGHDNIEVHRAELYWLAYLKASLGVREGDMMPFTMKSAIEALQDGS